MCGADPPVREKLAGSASLRQTIIVDKPKGKSNGSGQECPLYTG